MKELHKNTFGDSDAAVTLVKILNENKTNRYIGKNVARLLSEFNRTLHELEKIDSKIMFYLGGLLYKVTITKLDKNPVPINTYSQNVLNTHYKVWLKKNNSTIPYKHRIKISK